MWQKENWVRVPMALNSAWGCVGLASCWSANTPRSHPSRRQRTLCCLARRFVTIFESPVQQQQRRGEGEEDRATVETTEGNWDGGNFADISQGSRSTQAH